jgi:hypothetical protein
LTKLLYEFVAKNFGNLMVDRFKIVMSYRQSMKGSLSRRNWRNLGICLLVLMLEILLL